MKLVYLMTALLLAMMICAGCKTKDDMPCETQYHFLNNDLLVYFDYAKPGSYYILKDSLSGATDSIILKHYKKGPQNTSISCRYYESLDYYLIGEQNRLYLNWTEYEDMNILNISYARLFANLPTTGSGYYNIETRMIPGELPGTDFENVKCIFDTRQSDGKEHFLKGAYFARELGLVRVEYTNGMVWKLIRYKIER